MSHILRVCEVTLSREATRKYNNKMAGDKVTMTHKAKDKISIVYPIMRQSNTKHNRSTTKSFNLIILKLDYFNYVNYSSNILGQLLRRTIVVPMALSSFMMSQVCWSVIDLLLTITLIIINYIVLKLNCFRSGFI